MPKLPNHRLLARAFHRVNPTSQARNLSTTPSLSIKNDEKTNVILNSKDTHNVQKDASESGLKERAKGEQSGSSAINERDEKNSNAKAKEEHPEAPGPVLGMNDERGGVC